MTNEIIPAGDAEKRDAQGRFKKGQSGNAGGRPKTAKEVREIARKYGPQAVRFLYECMSSGDVKDNVRVAAAVALLDRGYGKPAQAIVGDDDAPPVRVAVVKHRLDDIDTIKDLMRHVREKNENAGKFE